jgi:alpha-tubulin suppressor-like RCC1 family protein
MAGIRASRSSAILAVSIALAAVAAACAEQATQPRVAPATTVVITAGPRNTTAGLPVGAPLAVAIHDSAGRLAADSPTTVTLSIVRGSGTAGAHLRGDTIAATTDGVATFAVSIDSAGTGYRLAVSATGLAPDTSSAFDVLPGPAIRVAFASAPTTAVVGVTQDAAIRVLLLDSLGNVATSATDPVTLVAYQRGVVVSSTLQDAQGGTATFAGLTFDDPGSFWLVATAAGLEQAAWGPGTVRLAARSVTSGSLHTCVVALNDAAYCWGDDWYGELGDGMDISDPNRGPLFHSWPSRVLGQRFTSVQAGLYATCGVALDGQAYCWGYNQPYTVTFSGASSTPMAVPGTSALRSVSIGTHACGVSSSGAASCWGGNDNGELGSGSFGPGSATPRPVPGGLVFETIWAGIGATCGVTSGHEAYCWGFSYGGNLGTGPSAPAALAVPTRVAGGLAWRDVRPQRETSCGVTTSGAAYCWGSNASGALGDGTATNSASPVAVSGGLSFASISVGLAHSCGLTAGGEGYCWGDNFLGQLGDGTTSGSAVPVRVVGGLTFTGISAGHGHTCAVATGGVVYCWGSTGYGRLGTTVFAPYGLVTVPSKVQGF